MPEILKDWLARMPYHSFIELMEWLDGEADIPAAIGTEFSSHISEGGSDDLQTL
jgi:hypothetical protein